VVVVVVAVVVRRASAQVGGFALNSHSLTVFRLCRDVKKPSPPPVLRTAFINISINYSGQCNSNGNSDTNSNSNSDTNSNSALFVFMPPRAD